MRTIVFTGGGSAGHVTPNVALIDAFRRQNWTMHYIGSAAGIEKGIIAETGVPFHAISSGKLRRYFDLKNAKDPFKVVKGVFDAFRLLRRLKPDVVFSKGGFVSVPVVIAAWLRRIPVLIHESDYTPGLANKLSVPFARHVCVTFPETAPHVPGGKAVVTGLPIRSGLLAGKPERGRALCDFAGTRPVVLVMGGSLGARTINDAVRANLRGLLTSYQIVHLCGKGNLDDSLNGIQGYRQYEYVSKELPDLLAAADMVVSRAGATSIYEFLALRKPMLLVPLSLAQSRGDQLLNADSFVKAGFARKLPDEQLDAASLARELAALWADREAHARALTAQAQADATQTIVELIVRTARQ
ncbi:undecaprenyldiphospho-muramoylpentapeptide beta-N-acetylglucosaminyltransferase [Paenibacillus cymbidii]|uniref:undecaprenyldiphospho-muramoylpentapeptide beta-N-acetylglucosaminyltransferase n=1 Tax=Paenibacillus cymbidii TaxID=1639034 RepID=UPI001080224B|nr:undecaprenyldiphospho-muramoylpentapeptide beta-N-acetylglucosaminyltransferase [Paenibacillus cymbidii]